ncbi:succinylglutamate desuccinylase/aspartoacylase family protein [uncultured Intestinimonas sp.]|uniref:succinylglutamate desuccinylase/aspartoacylase domain-containing protein n=1 Tax=uncultured Intestinimonas sp. TaxID=1689265 RepID=UPI0025DBCCF8|nr:succinylglutamate desuccinylase/aspartoacylase family protein [uncultured Intestinimonas sp.]
MKLGTLEIRPGEKQSGVLRVEGCGHELPLTVIRGGEGETVLVTAGIHSAEYVGIQAGIELARELAPEQLRGTVILAPLVNVSGFAHRTMSTVYEDQKNLNREFPGTPSGTPAEQICHAIVTELLSRADVYIDLHSGDGYEALHPYAYYVGPVEKSVRERAFQIARRVEAEYLVESPLTTGGAYNHASGMGIPSVLIERGGGGLWSRAEVEADKRDVRRILAYLGVLEAPPEAGEPVRDQLVLREAVYETAPETGCWYPALRPGDRFARGTVLGEVRDCFGERLHTCVARADGVVLYQTASLPVLKDGPMVAYGVLP